MKNMDLKKSSSGAECEDLLKSKNGCRNYCACGIMAKCTAGVSWQEHRDCKYARKSSVGERCMFFRESMNGHCDCVSAQRDLRKTDK
ncbi:MAG: hypothetical protein PVI06_14280 [Desulfobacterales bacterium]|jgi:hypothetical protein